MKRRTFLALTAGGAAVSLAGGAKVFRLGSRIPEYRRPRLDRKSPTGKLSPAEMATILSLAEILTPSESNSEKANKAIESHVHLRTTTQNGYLKEYRSAVLLLDETSRVQAGSSGKFAELSAPDRQRVVERILWKYRREQGRVRQVESIFSPAGHLAFRSFVVQDMLEAFFRELPAEGWVIVGYSHYPGVPADPRAYSRSPESTAASGTK